MRKCWFFGLICHWETEWYDPPFDVHLGMGHNAARHHLMRTPPDLLMQATHQTITCHCLCPVPTHELLGAEDCANLASQMAADARVAAVASAQATNVAEASGRVKMYTLQAQAAEKLAGPRLPFYPDTDPPGNKIPAELSIQ